MGVWKRAKETVADVQQWGKDSAAYTAEQRVKRGEKPPPSTNTNRKGKRQ